MVRILWRFAVVVHNDAHSRGIQVVKLARADGPEECGDGAAQQEQAQGNKQVQNVYVRSSGGRCKRNAFKTTSKELSDIPIAAIHGCNIPLTARGRAVAL